MVDIVPTLSNGPSTRNLSSLLPLLPQFHPRGIWPEVLFRYLGQFDDHSLYLFHDCIAVDEFQMSEANFFGDLHPLLHPVGVRLGVSHDVAQVPYLMVTATYHCLGSLLRHLLLLLIGLSCLAILCLLSFLFLVGIPFSVVVICVVIFVIIVIVLIFSVLQVPFSYLRSV